MTNYVLLDLEQPLKGCHSLDQVCLRIEGGGKLAMGMVNFGSTD